MIFDVVDCYRKVQRCSHYDQEKVLVIGISFAGFLASIKEYERCGDIFEELIGAIGILANEKQQGAMLQRVFHELIQYSYIKNRLQLLHKVFDILEKIEDDHEKTFALNKLGFEQGGIIDDLAHFPNERSEELLLRALAIVEKLNDIDLVVDIFVAMSKCRLKEKGLSFVSRSSVWTATLDRTNRTRNEILSKNKKEISCRKVDQELFVASRIDVVIKNFL